jgi:hypothetical protein
MQPQQRCVPWKNVRRQGRLRSASRGGLWRGHIGDIDSNGALRAPVNILVKYEFNVAELNLGCGHNDKISCEATPLPVFPQGQERQGRRQHLLRRQELKGVVRRLGKKSWHRLVSMAVVAPDRPQPGVIQHERKALVFCRRLAGGGNAGR